MLRAAVRSLRILRIIVKMTNSNTPMLIITTAPRAERGHRVQSNALEPRAGSHYIPDGTVHAVDDQTGEVACGFDGVLIEVEASWESPTVASLKCSNCEQKLNGRS
jgi:hypothetical protein